MIIMHKRKQSNQKNISNPNTPPNKIRFRIFAQPNITITYESKSIT